MISVLILTKNEAVNIADCIKSCNWSDDIVVFDSYSDDETVAIVKQLGARVFQRRFDNYGAQREAARLIDYKYDWVLAVDADERPDGQLVAELMDIAGDLEHECVAYRMRRKDHFMGKWIRYSTLYPSWFVRFYRPKEIFYEPRAVHEYPSASGEVGQFSGHLLHFSFNKGLEDWFLKHVRYARVEAAENIKSLARGTGSFDFRGVVSLDPVRRRRALKELSFRLPFRPTLRFLYVFFMRLGILDGFAGYQYARMMAIYEEMIVMNMKDIQRSGLAK